MSDFSANDVIQTYNRYAPIYDRVFGAVLNPGRKVLARKVSQLAPKSLLEIGVGTGLALKYYPSACHITGIDICQEMLERAATQARQLPGQHIDLRAMDAENLDFADHQFDCVTIPYVLSVTPRPEALIREARRVCTPDGHILIVNHFSGSRGWWLLESLVKGFADRIGFRSEFDFDTHINQYDWKIQSVESVNLFNLSRLVVIRNG